MKVGIGIPKYGDSLGSVNFPPVEPYVVDLPVPNVVENALRSAAREVSGWAGMIPVGQYDANGHGDDYGFIFTMNDEKNFVLDRDIQVTKSVVTARISYGFPGKEVNVGDKKINYKDPSKISRLHLNAYARRDFVPKGEKFKSRTNIFPDASEVMHFSVRWIDGKFDNSWNRAEDWIDALKSRRYDRAEFNEMRTTYMLSGNVNEYMQGIIEREPELLRRAAEIMGPEKERLIYNWDVQDITKIFPKDKADVATLKELRLERKGAYPVIGYSPLLSLLSRFGDVSEKDAIEIPNMSMEEGAQYIFGKVLPAMREFSGT